MFDTGKRGKAKNYLLISSQWQLTAVADGKKYLTQYVCVPVRRLATQLPAFIFGYRFFTIGTGQRGDKQKKMQQG